MWHHFAIPAWFRGGAVAVSSDCILLSKLISEVHQKKALEECGLAPKSWKTWKYNDLHCGTEDRGLSSKQRENTLPIWFECSFCLCIIAHLSDISLPIFLSTGSLQHSRERTIILWKESRKKCIIMELRQPRRQYMHKKDTRHCDLLKRLCRQGMSTGCRSLG